jgi:tetratricopeptide (TPR) repeat protein
MDHLAIQLEALHKACGAFLVDGDAKVLYVPVDDELADGAKALVTALEWHPENRRFVFVLEAGHGPKAEGWTERTEELRETYERIVEAHQAEAVGLPELPASEPAEDARLTFAKTLVSVAAPLGPEGDTEAQGLLVVIAPTTVENPRAFARAWREMMGAPTLASVKWIWLHRLEVDDVPLAQVGELMGTAVVTRPCLVDRELQRREVDGMLARMRAAISAGAPLPGGATGARPRVAAPPHPSDPPLATVSVDATPPTVFADAILATAQALRRGDTAEALPGLRTARDACLSGGRVSEAVELELLLATLAATVLRSKGQLHEQVKALFANAARRAEAAGLHAQAANVWLMFGCAAMAQQDLEAAVSSFLQSADRAEQAQVPLVRFHALRFAGEMADSARLSAKARELWEAALQTVASLPEAEAEAVGLTAAAAELKERLGRLKAERPARAAG